MFIKECTISLVLPFIYDEGFYEQTDPLVNTDLYEDFTEKKIRPNWLNPIGETRFTNQESGLVRCLELRNERRRSIGLAKNNTPVYRITGTDYDILFGIDHIRVWFWKMGRGFFTIQISAGNLTTDEVLDFKRVLTDIKRRQKIRYTEATAQNEEMIRDVTIRQLITGKSDGQTGLLAMLHSVHPEIVQGNMFGTFGKAYSITYMVADSVLENGMPVFLENMRMDTGSRQQGEEQIPENMIFVKKGQKVHWAFSERSLIMLGDCENRFVCGRGGLFHAVFQGYMLLYQYYLCLHMECLESRAYMESLKSRNEKCAKDRILRWMQYDRSLDRLTDQDHINSIFLEYLCKNVWNLQDLIQVVNEEYLSYYDQGNWKGADVTKYQIFISYRRDGGAVFGRLLYSELTNRGYEVFFDVESLGRVKFNEELFCVIDSCSCVVVVLSPGALDRCADEDDWVRKEIAYAIKNEKKIIPVMMKDFQFPERLPGELEEFRYYNGVEANMQFFQAAMDKLTEQFIEEEPVYRRKRRL